MQWRIKEAEQIKVRTAPKVIFDVFRLSCGVFLNLFYKGSIAINCIDKFFNVFQVLSKQAFIRQQGPHDAIAFERFAGGSGNGPVHHSVTANFFVTVGDFGNIEIIWNWNANGTTWNLGQKISSL
jgi:hypothetical protein